MSPQTQLFLPRCFQSGNFNSWSICWERYSGMIQSPSERLQEVSCKSNSIKQHALNMHWAALWLATFSFYESLTHMSHFLNAISPLLREILAYGQSQGHASLQPSGGLSRSPTLSSRIQMMTRWRHATLLSSALRPLSRKRGGLIIVDLWSNTHPVNLGG